MTRILVSGGGGQLGQAIGWLKSSRVEAHLQTRPASAQIRLMRRPVPQTESIHILPRSDLDITNPESIHQALKQHRPDVLINAAAYTAVDKAESEPEAAHLVNAVAPGLLAQACAQRGIGLIHVSTDYVFDGQAAQPYAEDAPTGPINIYGKSKLEGEHAVQAALPSAVIVRTSWIFSQFGNNFLKTMLRLGQERRELRIVADQVGGPSYAPHIAQVLLLLARRVGTRQAPCGIYHYAGRPDVSWYDFALEIFHQAVQLGLLAESPSLRPISTWQYPTPAHRPAQSSLGQLRLDELLGAQAIPRDWRDGVHTSLQSLRQNHMN
ncbi:dTDP-4-dehydrorhamnose reductase [Alcaligenes aquatilis]|uniref:dTDP-4-dehydrorhamnose reductase n=1 Tax=Alcaligenes aquatilis TaxID=323284 RepID=A0A3G2HZR8_9BURK|nr:dTDP-4-dehydrorhamnose reductase [Alcaligenes aquatilis]AYN22228.1 dTDP-4-dehydrorhamnose reductase [Alcaligenes aquatilis]